MWWCLLHVCQHACTAYVQAGMQHSAACLLLSRAHLLPGAFMVTAPHARTSSWRPVPGSAHDADHLQRIRRVYEQFKARVASQTQAKQRAGGTA